MTEAGVMTRARRAPAAVLRRLQPLDLVVAVALLATIGLWMWLTRDTYYQIDDWILLQRGQSLGDLVHSHNGHLSVTYILVYRTHVGIFGVDRYWVLQAIDLVALVATPALVYVTLRHRAGAFWAAVASLGLLWPYAASLEASAMNHWGGLALAVVVAWALEERTGRSHLIVGGCLALGFLTVGGTVAVAVGAVASCVLSRAPLARWVAVVVPSLAWYAWYRWEIGSVDLGEDLELSIGEKVQLVLDGQAAALRTVTLDIPALAVALGLVVVALVAWRLWVDRWRGAVVLGTWWAANLAWWLGLASSRGPLANQDVFRYRYVGAVFLLLSLVPPPRSDAAEERAARAPWAGAPARHPVPAVLGVVVLALVLALGGLDATRDEADVINEVGRVTWVTSPPGFATPGVVDPDLTYNAYMGWITGAGLTELRDRYGPRIDAETELDAVLVDRGAIQVLDTQDAPADPCTTDGPVEAPTGRVQVAAGDAPVTVAVHRFGSAPVEAMEVPSGRVVTLLLGMSDQVAVPWVVTAEGGCVTPA